MSKFKKLNNLKLKISQGKYISEEDVRQAINFDLISYTKHNYDIDFNFLNEVPVKYTKNKDIENSKFGVIDSKFGHLLIEYKKPSVKITDIQRNQLIKYLESLQDINCWGVLTNAQNLEIFQYSEADSNFQINKKYSGEINDSQLEYICNIISKKDNYLINSNNINEIFGIENQKYIIKRIFNLLSNSKNKRTNLLFNEWQKLFNLSADRDNTNDTKKQSIRIFYTNLFEIDINNIIVEYFCLFSIQTYYSIILKILIYKLILDKKNIRFSKPPFIKDLFKSLENNSEYRKLNIINLVDGDFFSWYLYEFEKIDFEYFYNIIKNISSIETNGLSLLMNHFYENIFPFHIRHSMGEFYTPSYLARKVTNTARDLFIKNNSTIPNTILDPCCGSGIFIINAKNNEYLNLKVYGIDINPIAVLTSKINYLINFNLSPKKPFEIPIYLGDSTYFPTEIIQNNILCYEYELITSINQNCIKFTFPIELITLKNFFQILDELELLIRLKNKGNIISYLKSITSFKYNNLKSYYDTFIDDLLSLEIQQLNSIWLKIIGNYLKSANIKDVDIIVGNPPWVRWSNLPQNYRSKIKYTCRVDDIFSSDKNYGAVDLNICALLCYISIRDRLNLNNGILGFLMPDSILFNKSFEGFRKMLLLSQNRKFYLQKIERWNNPSEKPFFPVSLKFCEYYFCTKHIEHIKLFDRKDKKEKVALQINSCFNNHFTIIEQNKILELKKILGNNKLKFRSGISLLKGGYYLLKFNKKIDDKHSEFINYEKQGMKLTLSSNTIILENEIIYPFINAPMIKNNIITSSNLYAIFPFKYKSKVPYDLEYIRKYFPCFYKYFMSKEIQENINSSSSYNKRIQNNKLDIGIFRVGEYTYHDTFLIFKDNTRSEFAKIEKLKTPWGEKKIPLFDSHINFIDPIDFKKIYKRNFDNEIRDYIYNIFTQDIVKIYVENSTDSRSIPARIYNDINILL